MVTTPSGNTSSASPGLRLRRSLTLWDLILYGIIVIQPTAPMPAYGVFSNAGGGHVVTSILIAMIAMVFTAMSYGRMARVYPSAGSAYTYVGRELHPSLGYVTGWSMTMDYILNPLICTIWCAKAMADCSIASKSLPAWYRNCPRIAPTINESGSSVSAS
jgi:putrescine importer